MNASPVRLTLLILFTLSGLAGLVYESVWSHYLKLFLGHAAYAQTLVLCVYMGGLAIGAWLASRWSPRWRNALRGYAVAELLIGAFALVSHGVYQSATGFVFDVLLPGIESPALVQVVKWSLGAALMLPQAVLLGMTFPLMSAAFLRRFSHAPGVSIAALYFTNSLGGAAGVLLSGFVLIGAVGLPGTLLTGGIVNVFVGIVAWLMASGSDWTRRHPVAEGSGPERLGGGFKTILIGAALLTGVASFMYEIGWIRMLSLVLGATTQAFELMLSAFILGLALGGWWIRGRIERLADPVVSLARIQFAMGALAVLTLPLYGQAFELMESVLSVLTRTDSAYGVFLFTSHVIALLVMLPATICAGMTLPLITHVMVERGGGERSVGVVYAANTLGAIVAVLLAVHVLLPAVGLKSLIVIGGLIDVGVGVVLVGGLRGVAPGRKTIVLGATCGLVLAFVATAVPLDPRRMSSGVFRTGSSTLPEAIEVLFQYDGKTATVAVVREDSDIVSVLTNGKPDASIHMGGGLQRVVDESTQVLLGALPLALRPDIRDVAVIGLGSGLTTRAVLSSARLERVDTVEIENGILLAAEYFRPLVDPVFSDPRSRVHIDDAKTFFSTQGRRYDLIISEPSNPWVSGVSSLFTREFYRYLRRYLRPDGLFVQWLQIYEIDLPLVMSVLKALYAEFPVYEIYQFDQGNVGIVAVNGAGLPRVSDGKLNETGVGTLLERIGIRGAADLEALYIGSSTVLRPLADSFGVPENSDYFPVLDLNAPRARFRKQQAVALLELVSGPVPVIEMLSDRRLPPDLETVSATAPTARAHAMRRAKTLHAYVTGERTSLTLEDVPASHRPATVIMRDIAANCEDPIVRDLWFENARGLSQEVVPYLPARDLLDWWRTLREQACHDDLLPNQRRWLTLLEALGERAAPEIAGIALDLLRSIGDGLSTADRAILIKAALASRLVLGDVSGAASVWREFGEPLDTQLESDIVLRLLVSHTGMVDAG